MMASSYHRSVFINCPFDNQYRTIFDAIVFAVFDCVYLARCSLEVDDASQVRIDKIVKIIKESKYGIHDLSRTELDESTALPRFNMPLELGLFLGAKRFGDKSQNEKVCLILDSEKYRYQCFISDIAGQDIRTHENKPEHAIKKVRDWLVTASKSKTIPGGVEICRRYRLFRNDLPVICSDYLLDGHDLMFSEYTHLITEWLNAKESSE